LEKKKNIKFHKFFFLAFMSLVVIHAYYPDQIAQSRPLATGRNIVPPSSLPPHLPARWKKIAVESGKNKNGSQRKTNRNYRTRPNVTQKPTNYYYAMK
jgi:hypothetical protein